MLWLYENKADSLGTWSSVNTSDPSFPPSNLQNFLAAKVWRSGTTSALEQLLLDLGATTTPAVKWYLVIHAHNWADVVTGDVTIEGHTSNTWTSPTFTDTIPAAEWGGGTAFLEIPAVSAGLRWWRISMTKTGATAKLQIGRISLGPGALTADDGTPDMAGLERTWAEQVNRESGILGQVYAEQRAQFWRIKGKVTAMTETTAAALRPIWQACGTWKPFFILINPEGWPTDTWGTPYYVRLAAPPTEPLRGYGAGYLWDVPLSWEQQL